MSLYIHLLSDWPRFRWNDKTLSLRLADVRHRQGRLLGRMEGLGFSLRSEALLNTLTLDVLKSSEIEGEVLNVEQVRSSIARRLGMDMGALVASDRYVEGVVEMMLDATQNFDKPLTQERVLGWHAALFPTGYSGLSRITVGSWRNDAGGPMQVVSGPLGHERVHYQAPAATRLETEMSAFLDWFNNDAGIDPVVKAALAHLWFVTLHPFEDGNGRIARALADMTLSRSDETPQRFYSMSAQIRQQRKAYYDVLEQTQKGDLDVTAWIAWFLDCLDRALDGTEAQLETIFRKARFWESSITASLNERQRLVLNKLIDGFEGKLTTSKWAKIAKCSPDTALRDIQDLLGRGLLAKDASGGRSTHYLLAQR
jgi:Fic family protein